MVRPAAVCRCEASWPNSTSASRSFGPGVMCMELRTAASWASLSPEKWSSQLTESPSSSGAALDQRKAAKVRPSFNERRQPSRDGTSRMMREYQVRICERLGVKFPEPTRQSQRFPPDASMLEIPPTAESRTTRRERRRDRSESRRRAALERNVEMDHECHRTRHPPWIVRR